MVDKELVIKIAKLSRLSLKEEELEYFKDQFEKIFALVEKLNELNLEAIEEEVSPSFFRKDEPVKALTQEEALLNAPSKKDGFFVVPKVSENL